MNRFFIFFAAVAALCFSGCQDSLMVDERSQDQGPAPYSPDPTGQMPQRAQDSNPLGNDAPRF